MRPLLLASLCAALSICAAPAVAQLYKTPTEKSGDQSAIVVIGLEPGNHYYLSHVSASGEDFISTN